MVRYPDHANELAKLLKNDQEEKKRLARKFMSNNTAGLDKEQAQLNQKTYQRTKRLLEILDELHEPSISNIGSDGALAVSVLASHHDLTTLQIVLDKFVELYEKDRQNCRYQSIPAMTDAVLILERKRQRFGTQWFFDSHKYPFLPPVEDFEHVNIRRAEYGIEPFRWPKSLAIPASDQPWLKRPLSELVMREPTEAEYALYQKH